MSSFWILENTVLPLMVRFPEPQRILSEPMEDRPHPRICPHPPGTYCFYCSCGDCRMFFATKRVNPRKQEIPRTPRYSYMGLVNSLRAAAAKREEDRQEKLQAERDRIAGVISPKKEKVTKTPKKKILRQSIKRRRV